MEVGIASEIKEPGALMVTSNPIPKYRPTTTCLVGNDEDDEEKNIIRTIFVAARCHDVIPIAIRAVISTTIS